MSYKLEASGGLFDLDTISQYEELLGEGDRGLIELDLRLPVTQSIASELESKLRLAGVEEVSVSTASPLLRIYFRKGFPWLAIIAATVLGLVVLAVLIMGWRLFREVLPAELQPVVGGLVGVALVVLLGMFILGRSRR